MLLFQSWKEDLGNTTLTENRRRILQIYKILIGIFCQHTSENEAPGEGCFFRSLEAPPGNEAHLWCMKRVAKQLMKQPSAHGEVTSRFASRERSECFIDKAMTLYYNKILFFAYIVLRSV